MKKNNFTVPLLVGGATTSVVHTAVKILPEYRDTIHVKDASEAAIIASKLMNPMQKKQFMTDAEIRCRNIVSEHENMTAALDLISIEAARKNRFVPDLDADPVKPNMTGWQMIKNFPLNEVIPAIDWTQFFISWGIRGKYPEVLNDPEKGEEAKKLHNDAMQMIEEIKKRRWISLSAVTGYFAANTMGDDIHLYRNPAIDIPVAVIHTLRQQMKHNNNTPNYALSDFIFPRYTGIPDYIGMFVLSASGLEIPLIGFEKDNDSYSGFMLKMLANTFAEAFAETLHQKVARETWGYFDKTGSIGIRPAPGYPAFPDHSEKQTIFSLLNAEKYTGVKLTENFMMAPESSICGFYLANPAAKYFAVGKIKSDQFQDYAARKKADPETLKKWLSTAVVG